MTEPADLTEPELAFTGERFVPGAGGDEIALEHVHRYAAAAGIAEGKDVVDLGCGAGYGATILAGAGSYRGYDVSAEAVTYARGRFGSTNVEFQVADAAAVPLPDGAVDLVVCFEVLEHVEDPGAIVREACRLLRPGGQFVSSTPDRTAYNRTRQEPNPFHLAEMERHEYESLLGGYFAHVQLYGQAYASTSWLLPENGSPGRQINLLDEKLAGSGPPGVTPIYWVAVCSDEPVTPWTGSALLADSGGRSDLLAELEARRIALEQADARELRARAQLAAYEETIQALQQSSSDRSS